MNVDNPYLRWNLKHLWRGSAFVAVVVFLLLFYGAVALVGVVWANDWNRKVEQLLGILVWLTWGANLFVLCIYAPVRMAQSLARERERGTLETLRLTGLRGTELVIGQLGQAYTVPLIQFGLTLPVVIAGLGADGGVELTLRGYAVLLLLSLCYTLMGGYLGLSVKKAQSASGGVVMGVGVLISLSGLYKAPLGAFPLAQQMAMLGPWGATVGGQSRDGWEVWLFGAQVPGDMLQLPVLLVFAGLLLHGLGRRLWGEQASFLGYRASLGLAALVAFVVGATFVAQPAYSGLNSSMRYPPAEVFVPLSVLVVFLVLLVHAFEVPVRYWDLTRGFARRDADDMPFFEERLGGRRLLPGVLVLLGVVALMLPQLVDAQARLAWELGLCCAVAVCAWVFAVLVLQCVTLLTKDQGYPRVFGVIALAAVWFGPLLAGQMGRLVGVPKDVSKLTRVFNPFYGTFVSMDRDMIPSAMACLALHAFGCLGLLMLLGKLRDASQERAWSLVALPADAYGAPGSLTKTCANGHVFAETWRECPHCAEAETA